MRSWCWFGVLWGCCGVVVGLVPVSVKLPQIWWVQPRTTSVVAFSEGKLIPRASSKERCDAMTPSTPNSLVCAADVPFQLDVQATSYGSCLTCSASTQGVAFPQLGHTQRNDPKYANNGERLNHPEHEDMVRRCLCSRSGAPRGPVKQNCYIFPLFFRSVAYDNGISELPL
jgi:hypothetical protein